MTSMRMIQIKCQYNLCDLWIKYNVTDQQIERKIKSYINKEKHQIKTTDKLLNTSISQVKRQSLINKFKDPVNNKGIKDLIRLAQKSSSNYSETTLKILGGGSCINKIKKAYKQQKSQTEEKVSQCKTPIHAQNVDEQSIQTSIQSYENIEGIFKNNRHFEIQKIQEQIYVNGKIVSFSLTLDFIKEMLNQLNLKLLKFIFIFRFLFQQFYGKHHFCLNEIKFWLINPEDDIDVVYFKYLGWYHSLTIDQQNQYKNEFRDEYYYKEELQNYEYAYQQLLKNEQFKIQLISPFYILSDKIAGKVKKLEISWIENGDILLKEYYSDRYTYLKRIILNWISFNQLYLIVDQIYFEIYQRDLCIDTYFENNAIFSYNISINFRNYLDKFTIKNTYEIKRLELYINKEEQTFNFKEVKLIRELYIKSWYPLKQLTCKNLIQQCEEHQNISELVLNLYDCLFSDCFWKLLIFSDIMIRPINEHYYLKAGLYRESKNYEKVRLLMNKYTQIMQINAFIKNCSSFFLFPNRILYDLYEDFELI